MHVLCDVHNMHRKVEIKHAMRTFKKQNHFIVNLYPIVYTSEDCYAINAFSIILTFFKVRKLFAKGYTNIYIYILERGCQGSYPNNV